MLSGLLIRAENGLVTISSFDYEVSAQLSIEANIDSDGTVLVSGRLLNDIVKSFPNAPVSFSLEDSKVRVTCRSSNFTLATMPVDEYPELPSQPQTAGTVDGSVFARAVSQVITAASRDDTLPILTAVKLEIEGDTITFLATDRYRLAMREIRWTPSQPDVSTSVLIKAKTLNDVAKSLAGGGDLQISLSEDDALVGFSSGSRRTTSVLVDGDYPKIRQLFPEDTPIHAVVNTAELIEASRRVSLVSGATDMCVCTSLRTTRWFWTPASTTMPQRQRASTPSSPVSRSPWDSTLRISMRAERHQHRVPAVLLRLGA